MILSRSKNVFWLLGKTGHLKTLRHLDVSWSDIKVLPDDSIVNLANLQTLNLYGCRGFEALPENIGLLKHLSYLNLSYTAITKIPDSITCITNLMALKFRQCRNLVALPAELGDLTQLRCLDLRDTKIKVLPESCISKLCNLEIVDFGSRCELPKEIRNWPKLRQFRHIRHDDAMPRGMEKLTCLEAFKSNMERKDTGIMQVRGSTQELAALNSLQVLHIGRLENVRGIEDAERVKLRDKQNLRELYLEWSSDRDDMFLEGLQPHPNLRILQITGFPGLNLPRWMSYSSFNCLLPNLVELKLSNCNSCEKLPALGMLPCLRDLKIWEMKSLRCLDGEFYYQQQEECSSLQKSTTKTSSLFPSLVNFRIFNMENLEEWLAPPLSYSFPLQENLELQSSLRVRSAPNSFPCLKILVLYDCLVLTSLPDLRLWTSLRELTIFNCKKMNKDCIPYDLMTSLSYLGSLKVDFIQREDKRLGPLGDVTDFGLINLMG